MNIAGTDVARFTDGNTLDTAANFTATIDWADGSTTTGTVIGSNGSFTVTALNGHTYADEAVYQPTVTITRTTDSAQLVLQSPGVVISDIDNLVSQGASAVVGNAGVSTGTVTVATFKNVNTENFNNVVGDFIVNVDWGDGQTTPGTLTFNSVTNVYSVTGSHTYAANGQYTITTFMNDDASGGDANVGFATTQADIGFGGTVTLTAAAETVPLAATTTVATFSDNTGDPITDYSAQIAWGDGTPTTTGTIVAGGSPGTFSVEGGHTYADEGLYNPTVTIVRATDGTVPGGTIAPSGTVTVVENDVFDDAVGTTITGSPGSPVGGTLATFKDFSNFSGGSPAPISDFVATVDWGDGQPATTGTITLSGGTYTVTGSHIYAQSGQDTITVGIADGGEAQENGQNTANITAQSTALIGFAPVAGSDFSATEGSPVAAGTQVGTFTDSDGDPSTAFTASVDWGDGTVTAGTVSGTGPTFTVTAGSHTYADEGPYLVTTTVTDTVTPATITMTGNATVADADHLSVTGDSFNGIAGQALNNVQVATFTDTYTGANPSDFNVTVEWGDGQSSVGTVSGSGGTYTVNGTHTYANGGTDTVKVTVGDDDFGTATATGTATASINLGGTMVLQSATEGTLLSNGTPIATFNDSDPDTASSFTATIDWGDGITTAGTVVGGPGPGTFTVDGSHTYADEGDDTAVVKLTRTTDSSTAVVSGTVSVAEADHLTGIPTSFSTSAGSSFSGAVATFTDTTNNINFSNNAGDFTATIDWGNGTTTLGTVTGSGGSYTVSGSNSYDTYGVYSVKVTGADDDSGTATFSATSSATVSLGGQMDLTSATEAVSIANGTAIATFTGANPNQGTGTFSATIDWGDGNTTTGTVVGSGGTLTVEGGHTYGDEGNDPAKVTLVDSGTGIQSTASGTVAVGEDDVLNGTGTTLKLKTHQPFAGTVATFTDTDTANVAGDFNATISWGDGTTTSGVVTGGSGSFTVSGTHTYNHPGHENIAVTLADDAPGTASATANSTANVSSSPKNDFNGDNKSDLLFQENVNSAHPNVMLAVLNSAGTAVASSAIIPNTKGWPVVAQGDFNGDNIGDVVLQNTDGTPEIWLVNGTTVTSTVDLPTATSSWHIIAAADFNGDGKTDLLFQATSGQVGIWMMNGTSVTSMTGLANPGSTWHVIGAGDFNGDGNADILFQNSDGTPMIWEMNGTSVIAQATLPNPGSTWKAIQTGDFNGDGNADILFQQNSGSAGVWLMNGTNVVSMTGLGAPLPNYIAIGTSDFNGDGNADLLFQNANGTPQYWLMNGSTVVNQVTLANPGAQWQAQADGPFQTADAGGSPSSHLSTPDASGAVMSAPDASGAVSLIGQQQQFTSGAGLHLT